MTGHRCVVADHWDRRDLIEVARSVPAFTTARERLGEFTDEATDALNDVFFLLLKADPRLVPAASLLATHQLNHTVISHIAGLAVTARLRHHTVGDRFAAALACAEIEKLMEPLYQRTISPETTNRELRQGIAKVADQLAASAATGRAWGFEQGALQAMSTAERLKLAQLLNTHHMTTIANLFGRIENLSFGLDISAIDMPYEDLYDVEFGDDIAKVLPCDLMLLGNPTTQQAFFAKLSDHELLQYAMHAETQLGRGGIVVCIDGSGSMYGPREHWATAVLLVLIHLARRQHRPIHVVHFGNRDQYTTFDFTTPDSFTPNAIVAAAETFYGEGTDYVTPMSVARDLVLADARNGHTHFDVLFISDDEGTVPTAFMDIYLAEMAEVGARTWAICVAGHAPAADGALHHMTNGRVMSVTDLHSGRDITGLLAGVQ